MSSSMCFNRLPSAESDAERIHIARVEQIGAENRNRNRALTSEVDGFTTIPRLHLNQHLERIVSEKHLVWRNLNIDRSVAINIEAEQGSWVTKLWHNVRLTGEVDRNVSIGQRPFSLDANIFTYSHAE